MEELIKNHAISKQDILDVLQDYLEVENSIIQIITLTGYKNEYIAKKLKMPISTYYTKRRNKSFTAKEVLKIVNLIDAEELQNKEELRIIEKRINEEVISSEEFKKQLLLTVNR